MSEKRFENSMINIILGRNDSFITIESKVGNNEFKLAAPEFEIENQVIDGKSFIFSGIYSEKTLRNNGRELSVQYNLPSQPDIQLLLSLRIFPDSPFIRYKYSLVSSHPKRMTKESGKDNITYTRMVSSNIEKVTELQLSQYESIGHSYVPYFEAKGESELAKGCRYPGPITFLENTGYCCALAYEHGAEAPESFLDFHAKGEDGSATVTINASKGNYYNGQIISQDCPFQSPWFHFALAAGNRDDMLKHYRSFILNYLCENNESRKPYIFYNTWNKQERNRSWYGKTILENMNLEDVLKEIDIAHSIGVDVFVIDDGWSTTLGDYGVNTQRFPDGLTKIKERLDSYGMKLGLWFIPNQISTASEMYKLHKKYVTEVDGKEKLCGNSPIYGEAYEMCFSSGFSELLLQKMKQLYRELGVTYFKWDGVNILGCESANHNHGTEENSREERAECSRYKLGLEMVRIAEEVAQEFPDVIFDYDITEDNRFVGHSFLSAGKFFLMNNGPYHRLDCNMSETVKVEPWNSNVFFYPGPARSRVCLKGQNYDTIAPSILFLSHFLPDAPKLSQMNSLCSLMLGANGIWGDLFSLTQEDIRLFGDTLTKYKKVADSINQSYPRVKGFIGSSPEIIEKINHDKAEGIICFFTRSNGIYTYVTAPINTTNFSHVDGADSYEVTPDGELKISVQLGKDEARPVFVFSK